NQRAPAMVRSRRWAGVRPRWSAPGVGARRRWVRRPCLETLEGRALLSGLLVSGAGPGGAPNVTVFDADTGQEQFQFPAFGRGMSGGVRVAVGDVNGDGTLDIVAAPGPGGPPVIKVFRSTDGALLGQFNVPRSWARGGVSVAVGDVNGDGTAEIVA